MMGIMGTKIMKDEQYGQTRLKDLLQDIPYETKVFRNGGKIAQKMAEHYVLSGQQCSATKLICYDSLLIGCLRMIR